MPVALQGRVYAAPGGSVLESMARQSGIPIAFPEEPWSSKRPKASSVSLGISSLKRFSIFPLTDPSSVSKSYYRILMLTAISAVIYKSSENLPTTSK